VGTGPTDHSLVLGILEPRSTISFSFTSIRTMSSVYEARVFLSADISEILSKTGFTSDHRYFLIPICLYFKKNDKFWTNLELCLINLDRYLTVFQPVFPVFMKTGFLAAYRYFFPKREKKPWYEVSTKNSGCMYMNRSYFARRIYIISMMMFSVESPSGLPPFSFYEEEELNIFRVNFHCQEYLFESDQFLVALMVDNVPPVHYQELITENTYMGQLLQKIITIFLSDCLIYS
jgi:hypothetical protein